MLDSDLTRMAWATTCEYVSDFGLRRHMLAVAAAMRHYADLLGEDAEQWEAIGLLHDFDWEIHPDLGDHPTAGAPLLRSAGWGEETVRTILSHYTEGTGVERSEPIDYALLACDEITGLVVATALVRPSRAIADVKVKSIKKKWKDHRFAAGVDRGQVEDALADFSKVCFAGKLELWEHVANVLLAMQGQAELLELAGINQ